MDDTRRRRRRGAELQTVLLEAAWQELRAVGYHELTYDAVAARARTSRTVLYRRWPHRRDLVLAAMRQQVPAPPPIPDTGSLRTDLLTLLRLVSSRMIELAPVLQVIGDGRADDSDLTDYLRERVTQAGTREMDALLQRAVLRGEINHARTPARVAAAPITLVSVETLIHRRPLPETALTEIVDQIALPLLASHDRDDT
ncbi:transcriptional regulator, TetR family [Nonomuraea pusilla]|uniref:Transcriptional regulator, TetR family n=2 Tax=Nonomuraea pusilla TaxID=46177 RepID=A0A1H7IDC9_9ACTN|nr:transcriptional regulator, TetR family [Nonomuraea pusilla]